jgi:hypothetical protein
VFGDGHGEEGAFEAGDGGLVRGGDDDDGAAAAGRVEVFFEELAHFAAAFADEGDDVDIGLGLAGDHAEEGGLADAAAGEDAEALAAAAGGEGVDGFDAGAEGWRMRWRLRGCGGPRFRGTESSGPGWAEASRGWPRPSMTRPGGLRRPARGGVPRAMTSLPGWMPWTSPSGMSRTWWSSEADDLGEGGAVVPGGLDAAEVADGGEGAFGFDDEADQLDDAAVVAEHAGLLHLAQGLAMRVEAERLQGWENRAHS